MSRRPATPAPKQRSGTARTVILVAVFAVLAGLIIGRGLSNSGSGSSKGNSGTAATATTVKKGATTSTGSTVAAVTTTTISLRTFTAIVLNGNGIQGTAGARSTELQALGVKVTTAADAVAKNFTTSAFYAVNQESVAAATALAGKTGVAYGGLYPTSSPPAAVEKLGGATIVLLLGKDIANQALTDKSGAAAATTTAAAAAATTTTVKK